MTKETKAVHFEKLMDLTTSKQQQPLLLGATLFFMVMFGSKLVEPIFRELKWVIEPDSHDFAEIQPVMKKLVSVGDFMRILSGFGPCFFCRFDFKPIRRQYG